MAELRYSQHLDTLIAVVTHLAVTDWRSRTLPNLAKALSIDENEIKTVLEGFKGLFRRSPNQSPKSGSHYYSLQIRYAQQWLEDAEDENEKKPPLSPEYLVALLEFISTKASQETQRNTGMTAALVSGGVALVGSIANIVVTVLTRSGGPT